MNDNERIKILKEYLSDDPGDAFSNYALALEYIKAGDDDQALLLMEYLYLERPEYLPNYYHFGKLKERSLRTNEAREIYLAGMRIAEAQNNRHTFNELKGALEETE